FFVDCLLREDARRQVLFEPETAGERIRIEGRVLDGDGQPVPDAVVEIWQADAVGRYRHPADRRAVPPPDPHFLGFRRSGAAEAGGFWFATVRPGPVPFDIEHMQQRPAPHVCVLIHARGLLTPLATRLYFADEPANAADPVLARVPSERRQTLLARRESSAG